MGGDFLHAGTFINSDTWLTSPQRLKDVLLYFWQLRVGLRLRSILGEEALSVVSSTAWDLLVPVSTSAHPHPASRNNHKLSLAARLELPNIYRVITVFMILIQQVCVSSLNRCSPYLTRSSTHLCNLAVFTPLQRCHPSSTCSRRYASSNRARIRTSPGRPEPRPRRESRSPPPSSRGWPGFASPGRPPAFRAQGPRRRPAG